MLTPLLALVKQKLIEARRATWSDGGELLLGKDSFLPFRFLKHSSTPFRYTALRLVDSGAWRFQKREDFLLKGDEHLWAGSFTLKIPKWIAGTRVIEIQQFLNLAFENEPELFLDSDIEFEDKEWKHWRLSYESDAGMYQFIGRGAVYCKEIALLDITAEGAATQP